MVCGTTHGSTWTETVKQQKRKQESRGELEMEPNDKNKDTAVGKLQGEGALLFAHRFSRSLPCSWKDKT
ncbi:hypothetical protein V6N12_006252 [Hibiscus sabdariffa]|uniref:Uncharacterized protein n=1 Tax=Hibiscus sabdariffa TaxID=183260 RepID=A0ABR2EY96_9ROSI